METADIFAFYGLMPVLVLYAFARLRAARARTKERARQGREVIGLVALVRERHLALCRGIAARPERVPAGLFATSAVATAEIRRLADLARERLDAAARMAMDDATAAGRLLRDGTRATLSAERLLGTRDVHLKDAALEMRCAVRRDLSNLIAARGAVLAQLETYRRNGYRVAVEAARIHLLGAALEGLRPVIIRDAEEAERKLRALAERFRDAARGAARTIAFTQQVRKLSLAFPPVVARTRATVFSVMRMRLDLDPRVDRETGLVIRACEEFLRQAESLMASAERRVASGGNDLDDAARDALRAILMANAIEARVFAAMEATTVQTAEGQPLSRTTILH